MLPVRSNELGHADSVTKFTKFMPVYLSKEII